MSHAITCSHPALSMLIEILKKEHEISKFLIVQSDMKVDKLRTKVSTKSSERVKRIAADFGKYRPLYYLELVTSNVKLSKVRLT